MRGEKLHFLPFLLVILGGIACSPMGQPASAAATSGSVTGTVTSGAEGAMEGVLVSARGIDSNITTTVVSNSQGKFAFPEGRLNASKYRLSIRAAGYDLIDPGIVDLSSGRTASLDLKLQKTRDLGPQLMNAEWLMSIEGTPEHKTGLDVRLDLLDINRCTMCHSLYYVTRNGHDAKEWVGVLQRMAWHNPGSSPIHPSDEPNSPRYRQYWEGAGEGEAPAPSIGEGDNPERIVARNGTSSTHPVAEQAAYLASINLSENPRAPWKYPLRTMARPKGGETNVVITQYDLPRPDSQPHDAVVDREGMVWYWDFGQDFLGRLDPRSGDVREWKIPALRPFPPFAEGGLDLELDWEGNPWIALMRRPGVLKFDRVTEKMTIWPTPNFPNGGVGFLAFSPSTRMVWFNGGGVNGIDLRTNRITKTWRNPTRSYGMNATSKGNLVFLSLFDSEIAELDTETGSSNVYKLPTPGGGARRGFVDAQDHVWFAEYFGGKIGMFDPETKHIQEWPVPIPYVDPYAVVRDKYGKVWGGGMVTDYIYRLDPATGQITKYLLPTVNSNIRRIDVDNSTMPVTVWVGENHHAKVTRIEVFDR